MKNFHALNELIENLKVFEGFRSKPYKCPANRLTIGYGHTGNVRITDVVTRDSASDLLKSDVNSIFVQLNSLDLPINNFQANAVAELVFNVGFTKFKKTNTYQLIKNYKPEYFNSVIRGFMSFCHYHDKNGKLCVSSGLSRRRSYDCSLWSR